MIRSLIQASVVAILVTCFGHSYGSIIDPNYDPIQDFANLQAGRVVVAGVVDSVSNVVMGPGGVVPEITLTVEATYVGEERTSIKVIGFNTCFVENGEWWISQMDGAPWLVPGDRVLIMAQETPVGSVTDSLSCFRLKSAFYILDHDPLRSNRLYTYRGDPAAKNAFMNSASSTLTDVLRATPRAAVATEYSLDVFVSAIKNKIQGVR
jgi:hypothetical protein